ncbi:MAG: preprotein translocase subunit SecE [Actinomycetota bacterium]
MDQNRATKRLLKKQQAAAERERARQTPMTKPGGAGGGRGGRFGGRNGGAGRPPEKGEREGRIKRTIRFLREVRQELKKVAWPSRNEVFTYTVVVLISVTFITLFTFGLDYVFGKGVLTFFKS